MMLGGREPVSENTLKQIRQIFGPKLASKIEAWALKDAYPQSTLELLVGGNDGYEMRLPHYIGTMIDVLAPRQINDEDRQKAVATIIAKVNELIASEAEKL